MLTGKKTLAVLISLFLVGQNLLFAAPAKQKSAPKQDQQPSLQELQAQADKELKLLKRDGLILIGSLSLAAAYTAVRNIQLKKQAAEFLTRYNSAQTQVVLEQTENEILKKNIAEKESQLNALQDYIQQEDKRQAAMARQVKQSQKMAAKTEEYSKVIDDLVKEADDLGKIIVEKNTIIQGQGNTIQNLRGKVSDLQLNIAQGETQFAFAEKEYQAKIAQLEGHLSETNSYLNSLFRTVPPELKKSLQPYYTLFEPNLPAAERRVLLEQLSAESWFRTLPATQQQALRTILTETSELSGRMGTEGLATMMSHRIQQLTVKEGASSAAEIGRGFLENLVQRGLKSTKALLPLAVVVTVSMAAASPAHAQETAMIARAQENIFLFINTPAEEIAKHKVFEQTMRAQLYMLHELAQATPDELHAAIQAVDRVSPQTLVLPSARDAAVAR